MRIRNGEIVGKIGSLSLVFLLVFSMLFGLLHVGTENVQSPPTFVSGIAYDGAGGPWTLAGSPYIIIGDTNVPAGQTLTIEPGVEVKFNGSYNLFIDGLLFAVGSETNRIMMTSNEVIPSPGSWNRIQINSTGNAEIRFSDITYSQNGIQLISSSNNIIANCNISSSWSDGIHLQWATNNTIRDNNVSVNWDGIILSSSSNNYLISNTISSIRGYGIILDLSSNNNLANNTILLNRGYGIILDSSFSNNLTNNTFHNSGIIIWGDQLSHFNTHTISDSNMVNGKPIYYHRDCSGININGIPVGQILLVNCTDVEVENVQMNHTSIGMEIVYSMNIVVANSNISDNIYGITFYYSSNNKIINSTISRNGNISLSGNGVELTASSNNTIANNIISTNIWTGIYLDVSSNNIIENNAVTSNYANGIGLWYSNDNSIANDTMRLNHNYGIRLQYSNNNSMNNNIVSWNNAYGISLVSSSYNTINNNIASWNTYRLSGIGISLVQSCNFNSISNNSVLKNNRGISLFTSNGNDIFNNLAYSNEKHGAELSSSSQNRVYHNAFIENNNSISPQAFDDSINGNLWNHTYYWNAPNSSGGNYWSDWSPICQDFFDGAPTPQTGGGSDGICDFQYDIDADSSDYYPLKEPIIEIPSIPLPPYITNLQVVGEDVNITWTLSPSINVNAYDIYGGSTQTSIDFDSSIFSTPDEGAPALQSWAQFPFDVASIPEYYFVLRARNNTLFESSSTSNTAGYYTMNFDEGLNTFSLPLEPFMPISLDAIMTQIGASSASWLDDNDDWWTYPPSPTPFAEVGKGYVLNLSGSSSHVFTGMPKSMIMYNDGWGFPANSLVSAVVTGGDVELDWQDIGPGIEYYVYWSNTSDGFFPGSAGSYMVLNGGMPITSNSYTDFSGASTPGEDYYMIIPYDPVQGSKGSSTYSVGVVTAEFNGNEMFGLPLKPLWGDKSADWYIEQIPNSLGIVYLDEGIWKGHFKEFPEGVYDTIIEYGRGYEITTFATSTYSFIGL
jgi:parallel beta-helix repeat protein